MSVSVFSLNKTSSPTMDSLTSLSTISPSDLMTKSDTTALPMSPSATSAEGDSEKKSVTKKRKSWGQELPTPKTNLPPRKRAKTEDEKEQRRIERVLRNRQAAQSSRERKRQEVEKLETNMHGVFQQNKVLKNLLAQFEKNQKVMQEWIEDMSKENNVAPPKFTVPVVASFEDLELPSEPDRSLSQSIYPTPPSSVKAVSRTSSPDPNNATTLLSSMSKYSVSLGKEMTQHPAVSFPTKTNTVKFDVIDEMTVDDVLRSLSSSTQTSPSMPSITIDDYSSGSSVSSVETPHPFMSPEEFAIHNPDDAAFNGLFGESSHVDGFWNSELFPSSTKDVKDDPASLFPETLFAGFPLPPNDISMSNDGIEAQEPVSLFDDLDIDNLPMQLLMMPSSSNENENEIPASTTDVLFPSIFSDLNMDIDINTLDTIKSESNLDMSLTDPSLLGSLFAQVDDDNNDTSVSATFSSSAIPSTA